MKTDSINFAERGGHQPPFVLYRPRFVSEDETVDMVKRELLSLDWVTKRTARHEYFQSTTLPREYTYGNRGTGDETYHARPVTPWVGAIMCELNHDLDTRFNVCFLNKYDNEHQHLGWHADDFKGMVKEEPIAVVSFGAEREIWVKPKGEIGVVPPEQRILLHDGSLFVMPPGYQDTHLHRIPKHDRPCGWRISLTFRTFDP